MQKQNTGPNFRRNFKGYRLPIVLHPDPILNAERLGITIIERVFEKIEFTDTCWIWQGSTGQHDTPKMLRGKRRGGTISVRQVMWMLYKGSLPGGEMAIYRACPYGNKMCVHPNHLRAAKNGHLGMYGHAGDDRELSDDPLSEQQARRFQSLCNQVGLTQQQLEERTTFKYETPEWMINEGFSISFAQRFWSKVKKTETCWLWTSSKCSDGYGHIAPGNLFGTKTIGTHRASWMLHNGPVPDGLCVLHDCPHPRDNRACCNPNHLYVDTKKVNTEDAVEKQFARSGVHWNSRLSAEQVQEIRTLSKHGHSRAELARKFGISTTHVLAIVHRNRCRNVSAQWCWEI